MAKKPMKSASADARTAAPPAPARIPDHWPKRSQAVLPIDRIQPSPRNPRKTFAGLQELGESIRVQGLINPLVVRPLGDRADWKDSQWINVEAWELIAGERRFRACCLIGYPEVPVIAMPKTDAEVMELMLVENDQRSDVRPSEQAAAYSQLAAEIGAEAVAVRTGKPISQVRDLIRMARLPQWMLAAVDDGTISRSTAAVVARVPGELVRERAAAESLGLWFRDDEPVPTGAKLEKLVKAHRADDMGRDVWTHRDAKRFIGLRYCRELKGAPFDRKSLTLVADAGSCDACPKRAGNDPDLVADGVREDVCTDTECYGRKLEAWKATAVAEAVAKGALPMPEGFEWPGNYFRPPNGWLDPSAKITKYSGVRFIDELAAAGFEDKTVQQIVGKDFEPVYVTLHDNKLVHLVQVPDVRKALVKAGKLRKEPKPKKAKPDPRAPLTETVTDLTIDDVEDTSHTDDEVTTAALALINGDSDFNDEVIVATAWIARHARKLKRGAA